MIYYREFQRYIHERTEYRSFTPIDKKLCGFPYRIAKKFFGRHVYGETPLDTMMTVMEALDLGPDDVFYELGAGRGRGAYFVAHKVGCKVVACEIIPAFVQKSPKGLGVEWRQGDFLKMDLGEGTAFYLFGTGMEDEEISQVCHKIPLGGRVFSISYPLTDYDDSFKLEGTYEVVFPWGKTDGYLQVKG
ncbi:MAG: hypothetical protein SP1CHLAM54_08630 [Chlamydiia bacterium]|nr:hypothetical protein [Chlamydiia bacterium]MCH9615769.1 hypothetical protein [Chlamydiia bacterium]MCH9628828.1 hypothetical protein [Chlamydiia bacterium]